MYINYDFNWRTRQNYHTTSAWGWWGSWLMAITRRLLHQVLRFLAFKSHFPARALLEQKAPLTPTHSFSRLTVRNGDKNKQLDNTRCQIWRLKSPIPKPNKSKWQKQWDCSIANADILHLHTSDSFVIVSASLIQLLYILYTRLEMPWHWIFSWWSLWLVITGEAQLELITLMMTLVCSGVPLSLWTRMHACVLLNRMQPSLHISAAPELSCYDISECLLSKRLINWDI